MQDLEAVVAAAIAALKATGLPYALAGGLASNLWVVAEHQHPTFDVDFAILASETASIAKETGKLVELGGRVVPATLRFPKATIERLTCLPSGITIDLVVLERADYARTAIERATLASFQGRRLKALRPEDVILYKSIAKREKDVAPMSFVAEDVGLDLGYLEHWARRLGTWAFVKRGLAR